MNNTDREQILKKADFIGSYNVTIDIKNSMPLSNLCSICGKCRECEHPSWVCPKLEDLKKAINPIAYLAGYRKEEE